MLRMTQGGRGGQPRDLRQRGRKLFDGFAERQPELLARRSPRIAASQ
jgi:hypothetical protein